MIGLSLSMGPAAAAAATGFAGFAAVAAPSVLSVVQAQQDLAGSWETLSDRQRVSALMVNQLSDDYHALADSYEPQALAAFNNVVSSAQQLMPRLGEVVDASGASVIGFGNRIGSFVNGPDMTGLIDKLGQAAPEALDDFGQAAASAGSAVATLVGDALPLGTTLLAATRSTLGAANAAAHFSPTLTQVGIAALLLRRPVTGLVSGVGTLATGTRGAVTAMKGMTVAQRAATLAARAGPAAYVALAAGLFVIAARARSARSETEKMIEKLRINSDAVGNNLLSQKVYAGQLERLASVYRSQVITETTHYTDAELRSGDATAQHNRRLGDLRQSLHDTQERLKEQRVVIDNITQGSVQLSAQYGVTRSQARQLATAAGVDLSTALDKSGKLTADATAKIRNYYTAAQAAKNPTMTVKLALDAMGNSALSTEDRMNALNTALNAFFNPSIAVYNATTQVASGMRDLSSAMRDGKGRIDGTSAASLRLQSAFSNQLQNVANLWAATNRLNGGEERAKRTISAQLPVLYALVNSNKAARQQVDALADSTLGATVRINASRTAFLRAADAMGVGRKRAAELWAELQRSSPVTSRSMWTGTGSGLPPTTRAAASRPGAGGAVPSHAALGAGGPTSDDVPLMASVGEHMLTAREVQAAGGHQSVYRLRAAILRGDVQGLAKGGPVVSLSGDRRDTSVVVGEVTKPIKSGMNELFRAIGDSMAAQWKRYAASGGPVVQVARAQIGDPYVWGATGPNAFDCSGLVMYAWLHGAGSGSAARPTITAGTCGRSPRRSPARSGSRIPTTNTCTRGTGRSLRRAHRDTGPRGVRPRRRVVGVSEGAGRPHRAGARRGLRPHGPPRQGGRSGAARKRPRYRPRVRVRWAASRLRAGAHAAR